MDGLNYIDGSTVTSRLEEAADVVIIGSGAGGAPTAAVLAEAGLRVVLLEEGPYVTGSQMNGKPIEMFERLYRNSGLTGALGTPAMPIPLGRVVGGTTVVNSGTCFRSPASVLERWESEFGLTGATSLDPFYDRVEHDLGIKPVPDEIYGAQARRFEAASVALGYKGQRIPRNEKYCVGTGVCALGCPQDSKQAMSVSYVPRAIAAGARLISNARAGKILFDRGAAIGVSGVLLTPGGRPTGAAFRILANWVIVAAGALHTPALIMRSKPGIHQPRLGRNLHVHPATRVIAKFPEALDGWAEVPQSYNVDEFIEEGIFIQGQFVPPAVQGPNIPGIGAEHRERMQDFGRFASFGALISDHSAGRVRANGLVTYQLDRADTEKLRRAIAITADVFLHAGAEEVYTGIARLPILKSRADLERLRTMRVKAADIEMMAFHPMGTAATGKTGEQGVTDAYGRVFGVRNLAVADTSLFPTSNRINPQLTLMALAVRNARHWVTDGF